MPATRTFFLSPPEEKADVAKLLSNINVYIKLDMAQAAAISQPRQLGLAKRPWKLRPTVFRPSWFCVLPKQIFDRR